MMGEQEQRDRFSFALRKAMGKRNVSARQLAMTLKVDPRRVAAWQKARALPNLYESQGIAAALRVDEALFKNPPEVPPPPPEPYYPLERYLLEAAESGAVEGHRRASSGRAASDRGRRPRMPAPPARAAEAERE